MSRKQRNSNNFIVTALVPDSRAKKWGLSDPQYVSSVRCIRCNVALTQLWEYGLNIYLCNYGILFLQRKTAALQNKSFLQYIYIYMLSLFSVFSSFLYKKIQKVTKFQQDHEKYQHHILAPMLSYILFLNHVNRESFISTTQNKLLILPSLQLMTLVDSVSRMIYLIVGSKTYGIFYPYFPKWRKPMV